METEWHSTTVCEDRLKKQHQGVKMFPGLIHSLSAILTFLEKQAF
jgi:hypothetical protein